MKEIIDKIVKRISEKREYYYLNDDVYDTIAVDALDFVCDVIEEEMKEHNNGWIPCSERLPEEFEDIYIDGKLMDSDDGQSYKSVFGETEQKDCFYGYYHNGKFFGYTEEGVFWRIDAIAWQPLPAPYKEGE